MLKCNRCGQYYVPGFLDCRCRVSSRMVHAADVPQYSSINPTIETLSGIVAPPPVTGPGPMPNAPGSFNRKARTRRAGF